MLKCTSLSLYILVYVYIIYRWLQVGEKTYIIVFWSPLLNWTNWRERCWFVGEEPGEHDERWLLRTVTRGAALCLGQLVQDACHHNPSDVIEFRTPYLKIVLESTLFVSWYPDTHMCVCTSTKCSPKTAVIFQGGAWGGDPHHCVGRRPGAPRCGGGPLAGRCRGGFDVWCVDACFLNDARFGG